MDKAIWNKLVRAAGERGATLHKRSPDHIQIKGALLVNYYPTSKRRTAYVAGTRGGKRSVTPEQAVAMAFELPAVNPTKRKRYTEVKYRLFERQKFCWWCFCTLTLETATVDHIVPLYRGGLDNDNNRKLACEPCNKKRGSDMPEMKGPLHESNTTGP